MEPRRRVKWPKIGAAMLATWKTSNRVIQFCRIGSAKLKVGRTMKRLLMIVTGEINAMTMLHVFDAIVFLLATWGLTIAITSCARASITADASEKTRNKT
jgi:hypothetical protein